VQPPPFHEDLRGRDFTINSIALSLNPASRGLLLDPNNGVGDWNIRNCAPSANYTLYDDPSRLLRLLRFKVRLGFTIASARKMQYENAREAQLETRIPQQSLLRRVASHWDEVNAADLVKLLRTRNCCTCIHPHWPGQKLNLPGFKNCKKPANGPSASMSF